MSGLRLPPSVFNMFLMMQKGLTNMKPLISFLVICALVILMGCKQGVSGGPGASSPPPQKSLVGQVEDTFSMAIPTMTLFQGETKAVSLGINRGKDFREEVSLKFADLPKGLTADPVNALIKQGDANVKITFKAADDAALGDFTVKVTGHPTKGADSLNDFRISITKQAHENMANAVGDAAKAKWDEYMLLMQKQFNQFTTKYEELKKLAAKAEGQAKTDLDAKLVQAKTKLDAVSAKLEEMKSASADRRETIKEGVTNAFDDLKKIFE
jgi:hypothetical protein